mmetsp:Transcript_30835/g.106628  ORF Transcript_30835/g.106628 Transcript_30835/m.106628 type:complete len:238 (-) Transcript_30835:71-784(-)
MRHVAPVLVSHESHLTSSARRLDTRSLSESESSKPASARRAMRLDTRLLSESESWEPASARSARRSSSRCESPSDEASLYDEAPSTPAFHRPNPSPGSPRPRGPRTALPTARPSGAPGTCAFRRVAHSKVHPRRQGRTRREECLQRGLLRGAKLAGGEALPSDAAHSVGESLLVGAATLSVGGALSVGAAAVEDRLELDVTRFMLAANLGGQRRRPRMMQQKIRRRRQHCREERPTQ